MSYSSQGGKTPPETEGQYTQEIQSLPPLHSNTVCSTQLTETQVVVVHFGTTTHLCNIYHTEAQ